MKYFTTFGDKEVFPRKKSVEVVSRWIRRKTVKIILRNKKGQIALVTNPVHRFHLLPGGGVDRGERIARAGNRESREEAGYSISKSQGIGVIREYRARGGQQYETHGLIANVKGKTKKDLRTKDEKKNKLSVGWHSPREVKVLFEKQEKQLKAGKVGFYNTGFNIKRDKLLFDRAVERGRLIIGSSKRNTPRIPTGLSPNRGKNDLKMKKRA